MNIEINIDENYESPKIVIHTNQVTPEISKIIEKISQSENYQIHAYKESKLYLLDQSNIESIYTENGKVFIRYESDIYHSKLRLYEIEKILNPKKFLRISNSEIINFDQVKHIDTKFIGTLLITFKSGNISYTSRRYISKLKEFLNL